MPYTSVCSLCTRAMFRDAVLVVDSGGLKEACYMGAQPAHWCHLGNMIEQSVCGSNEALSQLF